MLLWFFSTRQGHRTRIGGCCGCLDAKGELNNQLWNILLKHQLKELLLKTRYGNVDVMLSGKVKAFVLVLKAHWSFCVGGVKLFRWLCRHLQEPCTQSKLLTFRYKVLLVFWLYLNLILKKLYSLTLILKNLAGCGFIHYLTKTLLTTPAVVNNVEPPVWGGAATDGNCSVCR